MKLIPKFQQGNIILTRDINGNLVYMDLSTGRVTSVNPRQNQGTIQLTIVQSVDSRVKSKLKADLEVGRQIREGKKRRGAKRIKVKGKEVTVEPVTTQLTLGPDRESPNYGFYQNYWKRKSDKEMWDQKENETALTLSAFALRFFPSHYIGAINEGKTPFVEDNNGTGSFVGDLAADIILPTWIAKGAKYLGNAGRLLRTSSKPTYVRPEIRVSEPWNPTNGEYVRPLTVRGLSENSNNPLLVTSDNPRGYLMSSDVEIPNGWKKTRIITLNGKEHQQIWHPKYGFANLDEINGTYSGPGYYRSLVTDEALREYNPEILKDPELLNQLRYTARKMDLTQMPKPFIHNVDEYLEYPRIWDVVFNTERGKAVAPHGVLLLSRGTFPGSGVVAESPRYPALFMGINRDMSMPYVAIGELNKEGKIIPANYKKVFNDEKASRLSAIDKEVKSIVDNQGKYDRSNSYELYLLLNEREKLLGQHKEFGGLLMYWTPVNKSGFINGVERHPIPDGTYWTDLNVKTSMSDYPLNTPDEIAAHLAEQGRLNGVSLELASNISEGFHDKGVGSELIWRHDATPMKSIWGSDLKLDLSDYNQFHKKGGKINVKIVK